MMRVTMMSVMDDGGVRAELVVRRAGFASCGTGAETP